jgi:tight adherence protein B
MNATTVSLLFLVSFILLMGLAGAALLIDTANRQRERIDGRLARLGPTSQVAATGPPSVRPAVKQGGATARITALIGCDYPRRQHYPIKWWIVPVVAVVPARVAAWIGFGLLGQASWMLMPVVWALVCRVVYGIWDGKRRDRLMAQLPDALAMIVRTVRVGVPAMEGIKIVGREAAEPTGAEFRQLIEEVTIGMPLDAALRATADRTAVAEYRFFATAVAVQMQTGGGLSDALEILADVVRKRLALRDRGFALTSEARTSAIMLGCMPFGMAAMMYFASPGYLDVLFTTPLGNKMLGIGAVSLTIGIGVMRTMIRRTLT